MFFPNRSTPKRIFFFFYIIIFIFYADALPNKITPIIQEWFILSKYGYSGHLVNIPVFFHIALFSVLHKN